MVTAAGPGFMTFRLSRGRSGGTIRCVQLNRFIQSRRERWEQLDRLLDQVDAGGLESLDAQQCEDLFALYRLASSDLNLLQTRTANPSVTEYLEGLVARGYASVCVPHRGNALKAWWDIVRHRFPATVRTEGTLVALAALAMMAGVAFGFTWTLVDPATVEIFVSPFPAHLAQTPSQRVAEAEEMERSGEGGIKSAGEHAAFSTMLFTHNIRVTVLGLALGLTFGVGTVVLLFFNGTILGSLCAWYIEDGVGVFFFAWVGPHGAIELPCIVLGCSAGLLLARAQLQADGETLTARLRQTRSELVSLLVGTATLLVLAGLIEGGFSQINEPTLAYWFKIAVAGCLALMLLAYLFLMPVRREDQSTAAFTQADASLHPDTN